MTDSERIAELKALKDSSGNILSDAETFNEWTGRVSGLLGFDVVARHKFDALCDYVHDEQVGGRWKLYENVIQAVDKMHSIVGRAISDLECNRQSIPFTLPEGFTIPEPVVIPDAAGFGYPDLDITRDTDSSSLSSKRQDLNSDEGLLWFWHHCHYSVKWRLVYLAIPLLAGAFFLGWKANKYSFFQKVGDAVHEVLYGEETSNDENDATKKTPKNP